MKKTVFILLLHITVAASAQNVRSLDACIRLAWEQNPTLRNSVLDMKENRMNYIASVGSFLPRITASAETGRSFGRSIDPITNAYTNETFDESAVGLDMTLSLFEGFSRMNRVRFERINQQSSALNLKDKQNDLAYQITDTYYKLLLEEKMVDLAVEQRKLSEHYLEQTEVFVELGLKAATDLQEVKARHAGDIYRQHARENSRKLVLLQLKQLLYLPASDTLIIQNNIMIDEVLPPLLIPKVETLYTQAAAVMPSLQQMELRQRAARKAYAVAGGKFSPTIFTRFAVNTHSFDLFSSKQFNNNLGKYIGIGISIPLLSGLERLTTLRKHKLNIHRLRNDAALEKQQLYTEVEQTVLSLHAVQDEHRHVLQQLNAETQVLKESERKWEEGLISVFQLMESRNRFISAKAELTRVRLQAAITMRLENYYRTGHFCTYATANN